MSVREITVADRPGIARLIEAYDREEWKRPYPPGEWKDEYLEGWLGVAADGADGLRGVALGRIDEHGTGAVSLVYVVPSERQGGLAKQLLLELVSRFRDRGATYVTLSVDTTNELALTVWRRLGFVEDSLHMNAPLDALADRLAVEAKPPSTASIHVQTDDRTAIEFAVRQYAPRLGPWPGTVVSPAANGWIAVYDERVDDDRDARDRFANEFSERLGAVVVAIAVEEEAVVRVRFYERGRMVDEYLSVPEYYGPLPRVDVLSLAANPTLISRLTGADAGAIRAVLRTSETPAGLPPARVHADEIAEVLGLAGAALGYEAGAQLPGAHRILPG